MEMSFAYDFHTGLDTGHAAKPIRTDSTSRHKLIVDADSQTAAVLSAGELDEHDAGIHHLEGKLSSFWMKRTFDGDLSFS
jgi:hypothetical protein